jgi:hypothetical protein
MSRDRNTSEWTAEVYTTNPVIFETQTNPEDLFFRMFDTHQPEFRLPAQKLAEIYSDREDVLPFSPRSMFLTRPPVRNASIRMVVAEASLVSWNISREDGLRVADVVELLNTVVLPQVELPGISISVHRAVCVSEIAQHSMDSIGSFKKARVRLCPTPSPVSIPVDEYVDRLRTAFRDARGDRGVSGGPQIMTKLKVPVSRSIHSFYPPPTTVFTNIAGTCTPQ